MLTRGPKDGMVALLIAVGCLRRTAARTAFYSAAAAGAYYHPYPYPYAYPPPRPACGYYPYPPCY
jgi:hypothetical protein